MKIKKKAQLRRIKDDIVLEDGTKLKAGMLGHKIKVENKILWKPCKKDFAIDLGPTETSKV